MRSYVDIIADTTAAPSRCGRHAGLALTRMPLSAKLSEPAASFLDTTPPTAWLLPGIKLGAVNRSRFAAFLNFDSPDYQPPKYMACIRNWDAPCPLGYSPSDDGCAADAMYEGPCEQQLRFSTKEQKMEFAKRCKTNWPCQKF
eukprot:gnl/TRDRNA2_/TRDRNA2_65635_c0_seq1.p1 gnl/TRDRNA2_/TRDRNA2_65635_c0~~gnl/TRDRNA2_/TRDRNA2_65635_c0_seq1.p1  ORF type:complete len:143 (+),score=8.80 gnl/TRDRNA2_/TRDRNA2_65635_c0_seq1:172-600(+)